MLSPGLNRSKQGDAGVERLWVLLNRAVTTSLSLSAGPFQTANHAAASGGRRSDTRGFYRRRLERDDNKLGNMSGSLSGLV